MADHETQHESTAETVSLGGSAGRGRLARFISGRSVWQQRSILMGSTALLAVAVLTTVLINDDRPNRPAATPEGRPDAAAPVLPGPSAEPSPTRARVWVGYHGLMVAVPRAWAGSDSFSCGTTTSRTVVDARSPQSKCSSRAPRERSTVTWLRQHLDADDLSDNGFTRTTIPGSQALTTELQKAGHGYIQYVAQPSSDVLVVVRSPDRSMVRLLVQTARDLPANWRIVPDLRGQDPQQALTTLAELDLLGRAAHNSGMVLPAETVVVNQFPAAGQAVEGRTPVTIAVLPAAQAG